MNKICTKCKQEQPVTCFNKQKAGKYGVGSECKTCRNTYNHFRYKELPDYKKKLKNAKQRAKARNIVFDVLYEDIFVSDKCPALGYKFDNSIKDLVPSLDRVDSSRGYEKDNVVVICHRANRIKSDSSIEELKMVLEYMKSMEIKDVT